MHAAIRHQPSADRDRQRGAVLFVSLVILLVMTLIGVTAMQTTTLEEKMAGNMRDMNLAFQAAERALRAGEAEVEGLFSTGGFVDDKSNHKHTLGNAPNPFADDIWTDPATEAIDLNGAGARYFIEAVGDVEGTGAKEVTVGGYGESSGGGTVNALRVVARGTGVTGSSAVVLQSYYGKLF